MANTHDPVDINPKPADAPLFPYNSIVGILSDADKACDTVETLTARGFEEGRLTLLSGDKGIATVDLQGKRHGLLGRIFKKLDVLGSEHDESQAHVEALRAGNLVLVAEIKDEAQKADAVEAFKQHGARHISYYTKWTTETIVP